MMNPYFTQMLRGRLGIGPNQSAAQMGAPMQMGGMPGYPPFGQMMPPHATGNTGIIPPGMNPSPVPPFLGHMYGGAQYGSALGQEGGPHAPADPIPVPNEDGQHPIDPRNPKFGQRGPMAPAAPLKQFKNWWEF